MTDVTIDSTQLEGLIQAYPREQRFALAILQDLQRSFNYIPEGSLPLVSAHINTPEAHLYALATFYKALSLKPKGKHVIKLCDGTACHMRGAVNLEGEITRHLGIRAGERSADGQFSLELVNCVGSCALAPVVVIDETYYGKVTMEKLPSILDTYKKGGENDEH